MQLEENYFKKVFNGITKTHKGRIIIALALSFLYFCIFICQLFFVILNINA